MFEGSLEVKLPTIWTDGKAEVGRVREEKPKKWEAQRRERVRRKKMQVREMVGRSHFTVFFQWFVAVGSRKVCSLKRRVRSHLVRWEMKNCTKHISKSKVSQTDGFGPLFDVQMSKKCTPFWREAHLEVKRVKNWEVLAFFGVQMSKKCTLTNLTKWT